MPKRTAVRSILCLAACATGAALLGHAQEPAPPRFRSAIDIVTVDVTVLSRGGDPVIELQPEDFTLTVDGRPRPIQSIRLIASEARVAAPSAGRPAQGAPPASATMAVPELPRRFVIAVDRDHIPSGEGQPMLAAAAAFVDRLPPDDRVAFWATPDSPSTLRFLNDREAVKRQIRLAVGTGRLPMGKWMVGRDEAIKVADNVPGVLQEIIGRECYKQPQSCPKEVEAQAMELATDARRRADTVLADLERLVDALGTIDGMKHLVLVTGGPLLEFRNQTIITALGARAASARVTVHALQVHEPSYQARTDAMRAEPETIDQAASAAYALASTTGGLAITPVSGEIGFKRLTHELSAGYLLVFQTEDGDRDGKVHAIDVKVRDRGWGGTVRARKSFRIDPKAPVSATAPPVSVPDAPPPPAARPPEPVGIDPGDMAVRLADYAELFEREIAAVVAEERFVQIVQPWRGIPAGPEKEPALAWVEPGGKAATTGSIIARRQLLSDVLLVQLHGRQWQSYRDVAEVDGHAVRDRTDRVQRLFLSGGGSLASRFQEIAAESARYNLGDIRRDVNLPTVTLSLLRRVNHPRFQFKRQKDETVDGRVCRVLSYRETTIPTLISTRNSGDLFIYGRVWLDQADGRVRRTELRFDRGSAGGGSRSGIRADYGAVEGFGILVPVRMWEWYEGVNMTGRIGGDLTGAQGLATYSRFRRFQVSTSESVKH